MAPVIEQLFVETGMATFEFRDYAFLGEGSVQAAEASRCAADQGAFWEYHDLLMFNIANPALSGATRDTFDTLAEHLDLDMAEFGTCMDDRVHEAAVNQDREEASARGVNGTPTIALNEEIVTGISTYGELFDMIEDLAAQQ